jgi:hypothetical protein
MAAANGRDAKIHDLLLRHCLHIIVVIVGLEVGVDCVYRIIFLDRNVRSRDCLHIIVVVVGLEAGVVSVCTRTTLLDRNVRSRDCLNIIVVVLRTSSFAFGMFILQ